MVPYPEAWMDRAAVLNTLHGWTKTSVLHFRDLGVFGEQILLSIRFGAWSTVFNRDQAANWAIFWRPQIQNYMHAYRAVTGVDLTREDGAMIDAQQPSTHLLRRLKEQKQQDDTMMDFTSSLYLGMKHSSKELNGWQQLTTGMPAALDEADLALQVGNYVAGMQGLKKD